MNWANIELSQHHKRIINIITVSSINKKSKTPKLKNQKGAV
jgi:hypothetical protein